MKRITILVVLILLQDSYHGALGFIQPPNGLYPIPGDDPGPPGYPCEAKTVTSTIPVTITTEMSGIRITNTRALPQETSFQNLPPVTTTLVVTVYEAKPQLTQTVIIPPSTIVTTLPRKTVKSTIPVFHTVFIDPLTEITTLEKTITQTKMGITSTVIRTSIVTEPPVISVIVLDGTTATENLPPNIITSTIPIVSTMKMPHCCTSTHTSKINVWTTLPPKKVHHTPTITKSPITITSTVITTTHVLIGPKTITETVTSTHVTRKDCNDYNPSTPSVTWIIGPSALTHFTHTTHFTDSINFKDNIATSVSSSISTTTGRPFQHFPNTN